MIDKGNAEFSQVARACEKRSFRGFHAQNGRKNRVVRGSWVGNAFGNCTISGHGAVDGLHSIENTCTYKRVFFVD